MGIYEHSMMIYIYHQYIVTILQNMMVLIIKHLYVMKNMMLEHWDK